MNEINVVQLSANFEKIAQLEDPVEEMYELIKYASNQDVNEVHVIKLYEAYCVKKNTPDILSAQIKGTIYLFEKYCKYVLNVISHFSIFLILKPLGSLLIVGAIISFFISIPRKNIELKFKEIETVENSMGTEYSSARIQAMELLNKKCAKLKGINLDTANLDYVNFTQCRGHIPFSNHQGFDLTGANLNNAHLNGADLKKIVLSNAKIDCTEFKGANLSNANLSNSLIRHSDLTFANLSGADLTGTDFTGSNLYGFNLREAILDGAIFTDVDLMHADLSKVRSHRSDYTGANLSGARLNGADFHLSEFSKTRVKNIYVDKNTSFDGACINPESCKHYEDNTLRTEATKECEPRSEDRGSDEFEVRHPMLIDLLTSDQNNSLKWFGDRSFVP